MERKYTDILSLLRKESELLLSEKKDDADRFFEIAKKFLKNGELTAQDLNAMARWKGVRVMPEYKNEEVKQIRQQIAEALEKKEIREKIQTLNQIRRVGTPFASALLTFFNPEDFGIIDIRTHRVLCKYGETPPGECARTFTPEYYEAYINKLRGYRDSLKNENIHLTVRQVELVLWRYDKVAISNGVY